MADCQRMFMIVWTLYVVGIVVSTQYQDLEASNKSTIYFLVLVPFPNSLDPPAFDGGYSLIPAVLLAMDHINAQRDILSNYILKPIIGDSACEKIRRTALSFSPNIFHRSRTKRTPLAVVGPACSESSIYIANIVNQSRHVNIVQVVTASTLILSKHSEFPNTFGMISSSRKIVLKIVELAKYNSWKKVSIFYDAARFFFTEALQVMIESFADENITISYIGPILSTIPLIRAQLQNQGTRIIIMLVSAKLARKLACMSVVLGFTYPDYQIFYFNRVIEDFHQSNSFLIEVGEERDYNCTEENIMKGINGSILLHYSLEQAELITVLNDTVGEIRHKIKQRIETQCLQLLEEDEVFIYPYFDSEGRVTEKSYCQVLKEYTIKNQIGMIRDSNSVYPYYDGTWALALSLDKALATLDANLSTSLSDMVSNQIREQMYNLSFQGVSSYIEFDRDTGHVSNNIDLLRVAGNKTEKLNNMSRISYLFPIQYVTLELSSIVIGSLLMSAALLITILLHILNFIYRKDHHIKANSPSLNHFIFAGCYCAIVSTMLKTFELLSISDELYGTIICNLSYYGLNLCFDLIFGTLCVKLWRLYHIFKRTFKKEKNLSNNVLMTYIVLIVLLDTIFHLWMIRNYLKSTLTYTKVVKSKGGLIQLAEISCAYRLLGYNVIHLSFRIMLIFVILILSVINRNIKFKDFRSTKRVMITTYGLILLWSSGTPLIFIFEHNRNTVYLIHTVLLIGTVFLCQFILILPVTLLALKNHFRTKSH